MSQKKYSFNTKLEWVNLEGVNFCYLIYGEEDLKEAILNSGMRSLLFYIDGGLNENC